MTQTWIKYLPRSIRMRIEDRPTFRNILDNTGWLFADRIVRMGVGLIVTVWVARYLGPAQFGMYNYAIAFVGLFSVIATLGLDGIVVREIVRDPARKSDILGTTFVLKLTGGAIALVLTVGSISLLRSYDHTMRWLVTIIAAGTVFQAFDTIDLWFQSQTASKHAVSARFIAFVLVSIAKVVLILFHAPLIAFAIAGLFEIITIAIGLVVTYNRNGYSLGTWRAAFPEANRLLRDSWPLIFSGFAVTVYMKIDQIMLGEMIGNESVGIYSAATKISEIWYFIPVAIAASVAPSIIESKNSNETVYYQRLQKTFDFVVVLAYLVALLFTFLAQPIISMLYKHSYDAAGMVLAIHIWAGLFVFLGVVRNIWILAEGLMTISLITTTSGAVMNITLNYFLIPHYGPLGAAIATVISYGFSDYLIFMIVPRFRSIGFVMSKALTLHFLYSRPK